MIKNVEEKKGELLEILRGRINEIDTSYRKGPSLHFYRRVLDVRSKEKSVKSFLSVESNLELLYATLVSWDMNSRGAKMLDFRAFTKRIAGCMTLFEDLEKVGVEIRATTFEKVRSPLRKIYESLHLMQTGSKLVSNSKFLHFVFPNLLVPMDRTNTLNYIYGNTGESAEKYLELTKLFFQIANASNADVLSENSTGWNASLAKMIDNAVILATGVSLVEGNGVWSARSSVEVSVMEMDRRD